STTIRVSCPSAWDVRVENRNVHRSAARNGLTCDVFIKHLPVDSHSVEHNVFSIFKDVRFSDVVKRAVRQAQARHRGMPVSAKQQGVSAFPAGHMPDVDLLHDGRMTAGITFLIKEID